MRILNHREYKHFWTGLPAISQATGSYKPSMEKRELRKPVDAIQNRLTANLEAELDSGMRGFQQH